jgi:cyclopropane-fatty-acyl-phospholipid synthase
MANIQIESSDQAVDLTISLLDELFTGEVLDKVGVCLWDGTLWPDVNPRPTTIVLKHPGALRRMLLPGTEVGLAEAYLHNDFDVDGNLEIVFSLMDETSLDIGGVLQKLHTAGGLLKLPRGPKHQTVRRGPAKLQGKRHSLERDRQAIAYHYDVSNDFYALWLDRWMVYSCAYFQVSHEDIDAAQER